MSRPQTSTPRFQVSRVEAETFAGADLDQVLRQLTLDEKIALLTVSISVRDPMDEADDDDLRAVGC